MGAQALACVPAVPWSSTTGHRLVSLYMSPVEFYGTGLSLVQCFVAVVCPCGAPGLLGWRELNPGLPHCQARALAGPWLSAFWESV